MNELVFLLSADLDLQQAFEYYEDYQKGRGVTFLAKTDEAFDLLRTFPKSGSIQHRKYRRLLVDGFPYGIYYTVEARGVIIKAIMDIRQDPDAILRRLS